MVSIVTFVGNKKDLGEEQASSAFTKYRSVFTWIRCITIEPFPFPIIFATVARLIVGKNFLATLSSAYFHGSIDFVAMFIDVSNLDKILSARFRLFIMIAYEI